MTKHSKKNITIHLILWTEQHNVKHKIRALRNKKKGTWKEGQFI